MRLCVAITSFEFPFFGFGNFIHNPWKDKEQGKERSINGLKVTMCAQVYLIIKSKIV